ncbi:MAG: CopD family protein [Chromatiales bacterium]|nr:CopD family protein [Chromatiales bacterium]
MSLQLAIQVLHAIAGMLWVGGIFFSHMVLRPAALPLDPAQRVPLWGRVFAGFFPWVWGFVAVLLITGYADVMMRFGGFVSLHLKAMHGIGMLMFLLYAWLYFFPYRKMRKALANSDIPTAAAAMNRIRPVMVINLILGLIVTAIGVMGPVF